MLKVATGFDADLLDGLATLTDDDALLAVALDVDVRENAIHVFLAVVGHLIGHNADGVRNLVTIAAQDFLANKLGNEHLEGLVGVHVFGEPLRAFRQPFRNGLYETFNVEAVLGRKHHFIVPGAQSASRLELLDGGFFAHEVGLGNHENLASAAHFAHLTGNPLVARANRLARVDEERHHIDIFHGLDGGGVEFLAQRVVRLVHARRVNHDHLHVFTSDDSAEAVAGGLRGVRGNGNLMPHHGVDKGRFAGVRAAYQGDESTAEFFGHE